jgi:hypothetical protein
MGSPPKKEEASPWPHVLQEMLPSSLQHFNAVGGFNYQSDKKVPLPACAMEGAPRQNNRTMRQNCR